MSICVVALAVAAPGVCTAQVEPEPSLDELLQLDFEELMELEVPIVFGASGFEQKVMSAPSSVTVITHDEIMLYGYRSLIEILSSVRGFYATYDRYYHYLGVRGLSRPGDYNTRILLLIDGMKINEPVYFSASIGYDVPLDVELIERVEVVRGPSSSLYGTSAFFAIVNVVTRRGAGVDGGEIVGDLGSHDTFRGRVSYGRRFDSGLELLVSGSYLDRAGASELYFPEFDDPATNNGVAEDMDGETLGSLFASVDYRGFSLTAGHGRREKTVPTASWETVFNDPRFVAEERKTYLDLSYGHDLGARTRLDASVYWGKYNYEGTYPYDWSEDPEDPYVVANVDTADGSWLGTDLQLTSSLGSRHTLIVGAMYEHQYQQDQANYDEEVYLDDRRSSRLWALYAQDEIEVSQKLLFNLGVRHDNYDTFGGTTNPRLAAIYRPVQRTAIKLLYGTAFRAPSAYELYYNDGDASQKVPSNLEPETIASYELVCESYVGAHYLVTAGVFRYDIEDLIGLTTDPADDLLVFQNIDKVETSGVELELAGQWANGFKGRVSYTYQESEDGSSGEQLSNSPKSLAKLNVLIPAVTDRLTVGAEVQYDSDRLSVLGGSSGSALVANLNLYLSSLLPRLDVSLGVFNIFDERYFHPGSEEHTQEFLEQDGRTFRLRAIYRF